MPRVVAPGRLFRWPQYTTFAQFGRRPVKEDIMISRAKLIRAAAPAIIAVAAVAAPVSAEPNMDKFNRSCAVCHNSGAAGAPKVGDAAAWAPRLAKGMDALVASVKNGLNAMPPTGLCADCSDEEYAELITYMSTAK